MEIFMLERQPFYWDPPHNNVKGAMEINIKIILKYLLYVSENYITNLDLMKHRYVNEVDFLYFTQCFVGSSRPIKINY